MSVRLEGDIEKRVRDAATADGWWVLKLVCLGHRGFPDRWFIKPGPTIVLMEFKRPGKKVRKLQEHVCKKLEALGFEVWWDVDNYEVAMEILNGPRTVRTPSLPDEGNEDNDATGQSGPVP